MNEIKLNRPFLDVSQELSHTEIVTPAQGQGGPDGKYLPNLHRDDITVVLGILNHAKIFPGGQETRRFKKDSGRFSNIDLSSFDCQKVLKVVRNGLQTVILRLKCLKTMKTRFSAHKIIKFWSSESIFETSGRNAAPNPSPRKSHDPNVPQSTKY